MSSIRFWVGILAGIALVSCIPEVAAQPYRAGVGRADITPEGPIWMAGYGNRNKPSEGIDQPLYLKALAIQEGTEPPLLLLTGDLVGFPREVADNITERIGRELKIPRTHILLIASHTHTGPVLRAGLAGMFDLKGKDAEAVAAYTDKLPAKALAAASEAVEKMSPAQLSFGRGKASFAVNRRVFRPGGVNFGANPDGVVDHEVPVLRVEDGDSNLRAVVFGYACHCTTLTGTYYRINGDWAGYAQEFLERAHPGATALFVTGCGADADPQPRQKLDVVREHGLEMAGAVSQALKGPRTSLSGPLKTAFAHVELPFAPPPSREEFQKRLQDRSVFVQRHARNQLATLERDGKLPASYPCPVQVWQLGKELTLVALGGEVVVDYALRLKRELRGGNVWVAGYANDVFAYVPSARILLEGGYEAESAMIYYGLPTRFRNDVEEILIKKAHELAKQVGP
jgi:neutral ceramidase